MVICLESELPRTSSGLYPKGRRAASTPSYSALLLMGLAKPLHYCRAGGLLHHRFSFASRLAPGFAFSFLWHFPWDRSPSPLASIMPCGARTFLPHSRKGDHLTYSAIIIPYGGKVGNWRLEVEPEPVSKQLPAPRYSPGGLTRANRILCNRLSRVAT
jgi:hypothetical protein